MLSNLVQHRLDGTTSGGIVAILTKLRTPALSVRIKRVAERHARLREELGRLKVAGKDCGDGKVQAALEGFMKLID